MKKITILGLCLFSTSAMAQMGKSGSPLIFTPIVGIERVQKLQPSPHMKTRAIFGANVIYKLPIAALEVEYTRASDSETDVSTAKVYKSEEDKLKIGLRGSFTASRFVNWYLRGGAQARRNEVTVSDTTGTTSTERLTKVQPYVGTGIEFRLLHYVSLSADVAATYTPTDDPNLKDYELQPSVGVNVKF